MTRTARTRWFILFAIVLTCALLVSHRFLPWRSLQLLPNPGAVQFIYADEESGGGNSITWVDYNNSHWRCSRRADLPSHYCGYNLALSEDYIHGVDLSSYQRLRVRLTVDMERPRVAFVFRNFNSEYSSPDDGDSAQYINFTVRTQDMVDEIVVGLHEFRVADWWLYQRDIPRQYTQPEFSNITVFGINLGDDLPVGDSDIIVHQITLEKPWITAESLYLAVLLLWMAAIVVVLMIQMISLNRKARGSEVKLTRLTGQHQRLNEKAKILKEAAEKDPLSGLLNRRGLELAFERLRQTGMPLALVLMDIDHFKRINDRRGHSEGDRIIQQVARVISSNTRDQDVVARWGGEEFVILSAATQLEQARVLAEKIRDRIFLTEFDEKNPLAITASFGVANFVGEEAFSSVLERADRALYEAKAQGRNCTVVAPLTD